MKIAGELFPTKLRGYTERSLTCLQPQIEEYEGNLNFKTQFAFN